jgi:diguanylate cyclase (GGDEF)-like protein
MNKRTSLTRSVSVRSFAPGIWVGIWSYFYVVGLLAAWPFLASWASGWSRVVVSADVQLGGGSPGDVALVDASDATRMVVPYAGLPIHWLNTYAYTRFGAWLLLTLGALVAALVKQKNSLRLAKEPAPPIAQAAIRMVRVMVALLIAGQFIVNPSRLDLVGSGGRLAVMILSVGALSLTNMLSSIAESEKRFRPFLDRVPLIELILDSVLVLGLTTATGTNGIGWVLFGLPIIEAATRFRLTGALIHWMMLTGAMLCLQITVGQRNDVSPTALLASLEQVLDQLSVLLLVVLPGAYLAEQLMSEVAMQRSSAGEAADRSELLQNVVESSEGVNRLGFDVSQGLVGAALSLGFDLAEVSVHNSKTDTWKSMAIATTLGYLSLPTPGEAGSALKSEELAHERVVIDLRDTDEAEREALINHGLSTVVRILWPQPTGDQAVIRVATATGTMVRSSQVEALLLLVSQAVVASHNDMLVAELQGMHDRISIQVKRDSLTGLPNRLAFMSDLGSAMDSWSGLSMLFMDLNGFKSVNDRLGHDAGDELLCAAAERLQAVVGEVGTVSRLGGDEFTILIRERNPGGALRLAEAVVNAFSQTFEVGGEHVQVGIAVGIALSEPGLADTEALRRADVAMYHAKAEAASYVAFYAPEMEATENRKNRMQSDIGSAILDNSQIELHYQPILCASTRTVAGMEALLRWEHPELGHISPSDAVLVAQQSGVSDELTQRVLRLAVTECQRWQAELEYPPGYVSVNVSPFELESPTLVGNVARALKEAGLDGRCLKIELSEKILGPQDASYRKNIDGLRDIGVVVTLDDFGEGQTSLAHLRGLPIEALKLDRSLVTNSIRSESDQIILDSVTRLAHGLKFQVVAEGVETPEHLVRVLQAGCDFVQGYLFSRPLHPEKIDAYLEETRRVPQLTDSIPLPSAGESIIEGVKDAAQA